MKVHGVLALDVDQTFQGYLKENMCIQGREIFGLNRNTLKVIKESLFAEYPYLF